MAAPSARRCLGDMSWWLSAVTRPRGVAVLIAGFRRHHAGALPPEHISPSSAAVLSLLSSGLTLQPDFITAEEEAALCRELEPVLRKKRYESGHWDDAIHGFREVERLHWSPDSSAVIQRVRDKAFPPGENQLSLVHVLDLQKDGYIKPHVDSVKQYHAAGVCG
ncbi:hypothetical protein GDO81_002655 [Engystomops pustulosus]|uniref:AlkB homolog 7 n=1 Tax=Engystomops pustulosus TaxID=76066 RepID=A0AAV7DLY5_ENGPU|nr:hypothetical protein GDO81_002655 [Engystomops pustulosus]